MRRVYGLFALGVCSVVSLATRASAESYRLVEPTLVASSIQHGHLETRRVVSLGRRSLAGVWLVGGASELGFEELNAELARSGWSAAGSTADTFGFGFTLATGALYGGLMIDNDHEALTGPRGESGSVDVFRVSWQLGWHAYRGDALSVMPFVGLGVGRTSFLAKTIDPDTYPLFSPELRARVVGNRVDKTAGLFEIGIGAQALVPAFGNPTLKNGPAVGVQLGFRAGFAESDWRVQGTDAPIAGDPAALQTGAFLRLLVGWAWSHEPRQITSERVQSCRGPACYVACDPGFMDDDRDPRNGCETKGEKPFQILEKYKR